MKIPAFAKINLTLEVLGIQSDGYHEVKTVLQTVDLADQLDIQPAARLIVQCDDPRLNGEANLVWRAAVELAASQNISPLARIFVQKRIPVGMGLGGGSSDAAAALLGLNYLWDLGLSAGQLAPIAARLGSDVPFFLRGGTALGVGRGERVSPLPALPKLTVLLVCPNETIPDKTRQLYSALAPAHYSDGGITRRLVENLMAGQFVLDLLHNAFEEVAFQTFPNLGQLYHHLEGLTRSRPHLCGAGPALYCLPSGEEEYRRVARALQQDDVEAYLVDTILPSPFQEGAAQGASVNPSGTSND